MSLSVFSNSYGMARINGTRMGGYCSPCARGSSIAEGRQTPSKRPAMHERYTVGAQDGSSMERNTGKIRFFINLPPAIRGVGREKRVSEIVGIISPYLEQTGTDRVERMLRGREFRSRQKGGEKVGKTKKGKGTKWMMLTDGKGLPIGALLDSATPAEVKLAEKLFPVAKGKPERLVTDRGFDSNRFRAFLFARNIDPIIPARENNKRATHQDGRKLRRYRHRWIVERTFSWLGWFRCLVVRWMRKFENYLAFFHLACSIIVLKKVLG